MITSPQKSPEHFPRAETEKVYHDNRKLSFVSDESTKSDGDTKGLGFFLKFEMESLRYGLLIKGGEHEKIIYFI